MSMPRDTSRKAGQSHPRTNDAAARRVRSIAPEATTWITPGTFPSITTTDPSRLVGDGLGTVVIDAHARLIDHIALVVDRPTAVDRMIADLERQGGVVVEAPHTFPEAACGVVLPWQLGKYMASVELSSGVLVVGAPLRTGDQLDLHLRAYGRSVPHHMAVRVANVHDAVRDWTVRGYRFGPETDDGRLAQVFGTSKAGTLIELIGRTDESNATFSCANIAELSAAEAALRNQDAS